MKILATACKGLDLKPGDLFSNAGQSYWSNIDSNRSVGELVYIRTNEAADSFPDPDVTVYRITAVTAESNPVLDLKPAILQMLDDALGEPDPAEALERITDIMTTIIAGQLYRDKELNAGFRALVMRCKAGIQTEGLPN